MTVRTRERVAVKAATLVRAHKREVEIVVLLIFILVFTLVLVSVNAMKPKPKPEYEEWWGVLFIVLALIIAGISIYAEHH